MHAFFPCDTLFFFLRISNYAVEYVLFFFFFHVLSLERFQVRSKLPLSRTKNEKKIITRPLQYSPLHLHKQNIIDSMQINTVTTRF